MLQKLQTSITTVLFLICLTSSFAAEISFTGQTQVCPGQDYTYTASASNIFGARNGAFDWSFWRNNQLIGSFGFLEDCPSLPGTSTSTVTFNWGNVLGPVKIRVRFKGANDPACSFTPPDEKWIDVTVRVLSPGPISGLLFCSPNETRTLSVPGIPFNAQSCNYHYKYDWIVPSGWSVVPATNEFYIDIPGGIRTFATSVLVTSPSTSLAPRYDGNYNVIVRTEPLWPYPTESTGKVWVGTPAEPGSVSGNTAPSVGGIYQYISSGPAMGASYHDWILPYYGDPLWSQSGGNINGIINTLTPNFIVGSSSGFVQVFGVNACGNGGVRKIRVTPVGGGGGGQQQRVGVSSYPNPSSDEIVVDTQLDEASEETALVTLINSNQKVIYTESTKKKEVRINVTALPVGFYYLQVTLRGETKQERILIERN